MDTLDLHGVRHYEMDRLVENFILLHSTPVRIIVGNSTRMHELTAEVLDRTGFSWEYEHYFNLGALIIQEKTLCRS